MFLKLCTCLCAQTLINIYLLFESAHGTTKALRILVCV